MPGNNITSEQGAVTQAPPSMPREEVHAHDASLPLTRTIMVCLDDSAYSQYAFEWTLDNFARKETDLIALVNCRPVVTMPMAQGMVDVTNYLGEMETQNRQQSHELLLAYAKETKHRGFHVRALALRGEVRDELLREAKDLGASAIVIGSRGMSFVKRAFLGSTSDYLVHHCHCPVLVIRMGAEEEKNHKHMKRISKQGVSASASASASVPGGEAR